MPFKFCLWMLIAGCGVCQWAADVSVARGESVTLATSKDNTIIQWSPDSPEPNPLLSNGQGDIFVGRTNQDGQEAATISIRRGLIQFNLAGVPSGATITGATLTIRDVMGRNGNSFIGLHRVLADWGEGASFFNGGIGIAAQAGDVTWLHTSYDPAHPDQNLWTTPGGDFLATESASTLVTEMVGGGQLFSWSGSGMIADAQYWLAHPNENFGWLLQGDEAHGQTAKRLNSGESSTPPNVLPLLTVEFTTALPGDYNNNGTVDAADYTAWRDHLGAAIALANETATLGAVTAEDYGVWKANFGATSPGSGGLASVPEPTIVMLMAAGALFAMAHPLLGRLLT